MNDHGSTAIGSDETPAERLVEARSFLGLPIPSVAEVLGCAASDIEAFESGLRAPSERELAQFSALYRRPTWWLSGEPRRTLELSERLGNQLGDLTDHDREIVLNFSEFLADAGPPATPARAQ